MIYLADKIIEIVCSVYGINDIKIRTKGTDHVFARFLAVGLIFNNTNLGYETVSTLVNRDKTSIYWAYNRFRGLINKKHPVFTENRNKAITKLHEHGFKIH